MSLRNLSTFALITMLACAVGCGSGTGSPNGAFNAALALKTAPYLVLNLTTGAVTPHTILADLQTNPAYRDNLMVFRRITAGSSQIGAGAGTLGVGVDPTAATVNFEAYYCAAFEVSQAQWPRLGGPDPTPWTGVTLCPGSYAGAPASIPSTPDSPAFALALSDVTTALATWNSGKTHTLRLPSDNEWERACRAGTSGAFWWGNDPVNGSLAIGKAVVNDTRTAIGPVNVHLGTANPFGLFNTHGNVWEWSQEGYVRGGSWNEPLSLSRASLRYDLHLDSRHALVGARLVLVP